PADRRGERTLDADEVVAEARHRLIRQPAREELVGLLTCVDLHPADRLLAAVGLLHGRIQDPDGRPPDVRPRPVPLDERDDRLVGDVQLAVLDRDSLAPGGDLRLRTGHQTRSWKDVTAHLDALLGASSRPSSRPTPRVSTTGSDRMSPTPTPNTMR